MSTSGGGSSVTFGTATTITTAVTMGSAGGAITFDNTVAGTAADDLTLNAGAGALTLSGSVGAGNQIGAIDIDAGSLTQDGAITAQGQVDIDVAAALTIDENLTSGGATNITVTADDAGAATFSHTAGTISSTAGALTIRADDMALSGTITATDQMVHLLSNTANDS